MKIAGAELFEYTLPLAHPVRLGSEEITTRTGFLLKLRSDQGHAGWGEAAPLPGFSSESLAECRAYLEAVAEQLRGFTLLEHADFVALLNSVITPSVAFAVETAWLNLHAALSGVAPFRLLRSNAPATIPLAALLSGPLEAQALKAARAVGAGYHCLKLKAGHRSVADDIAAVHELSAALPETVALRVDANRAWTFEQAVEFATGTGGSRISYMEEPLRDPRQLPAFRGETGQPYAVDETLQEVVARMSRNRGVVEEADQDLLEVLEQAAAWIWKPSLVHVQYLLGVWRRFDPLPPLVLSAAYESGVGTAAIANYAAALSAPDTPAGLDTYSALGADVLTARLPLDGAVAALDTMNQLAVNVDEERVRRL